MAVLVRGSLRGHSIDGDGRVGLDDDALIIEVPRRSIRLAIDRIDGISWRSPALTLHLVGGEQIELHGNPGLEGVMRRVTDAAMRFPEVTRALESMGALRGAPARDGLGEEHDRFFGGLLRARRFVEESHELEPRLSAFSGRRLSEGFQLAFADFARDRYPTQAPDRRAVEAELTDEAEPLFGALVALDSAASALRTADDRERFRRWREWTGTVARAFQEADRVWRAVLPLLGATRPAQPRGRRGVPRIRSTALIIAAGMAALASAALDVSR